MVRAGAHDLHADARPFVGRLQHIGPRQDVAALGFAQGHDFLSRHRNARAGEHALGHGLVHGHGGRHAARGGVGQGHDVEQALDAAVLAEATVQRVENHIRLCGLYRGDKFGHVAWHVDLAHIETAGAQGFARSLAGDERDRALLGVAAHQYGDAFGGHCAPAKALG